MKKIPLIAVLLAAPFILIGSTSGTIKPKPHSKSIFITRIVFSPEFKDTNYVVTLKCSGNSIRGKSSIKPPSAVIRNYKKDSFVIVPTAGVTSIEWSVKHR